MLDCLVFHSFPVNIRDFFAYNFDIKSNNIKMSEIKIFVSKNDKKTQDKHPDLRVALIVGEGDQAKFVDAGGLWKSKSGKGYSGTVNLDAKPWVPENQQAAPASAQSAPAATQVSGEDDFGPF